ncbi:hypothetical protein QUB80_11645 [Chlorogloeopsis sp. ULAP01]|uniref:hypothetical protein n=1 Tax=Chlorogloeopsis sp. ULAP01 TaxID=3056483 RepID=UPI0025AA6AB9|nr:hypothetical protein [Chlorogloeopsis sp. ULAP01]MDM9381356.1 hypothetical protein [Chlorogloeopsis sp. ULAP01]
MPKWQLYWGLGIGDWVLGEEEEMGDGGEFILTDLYSLSSLSPLPLVLFKRPLLEQKKYKYGYCDRNTL